MAMTNSYDTSLNPGLLTVSFLRHIIAIAASCVLRMPLNPNKPNQTNDIPVRYISMFVVPRVGLVSRLISVRDGG